MRLFNYLTGVVILFPLFVISADFDGEWKRADERTRNAVIQVWTQATSFNWFQPYRSPEQYHGAGSGFFIDVQGRFLTNYHVVRGATSVYVTVPALGKTPLATEIIGVCPELDVALLTLTDESRAQVIAQCGSINALEFGDSDDLYETQSVLALGYPLGLRTLKSTVGCVAGRDFLMGSSLIHITAPINPGNSGGPLVNHKGEVVGINTLIRTNTQNYNYIVPSKEFLVVLPDLYTTKLVRRPEYNIGKNRATATQAGSLGNPLPSGVYINRIFKDSMEARAGLKVGDMLYEIECNGKRYKIDEYGEVSVPWRQTSKISLEELLIRCRIGDSLTYVVYRNGKRVELKGTFECTQLKSVRVIYPEYEQDELDYEIIGGLVVMQLRTNHLDLMGQSQQSTHLKEINNYLRDDEKKSQPALIIASILPGSVAHLSDCLYAGFILDRVNGQKVTTLAEFRKALLKSVDTGEIALSTKDYPATVLSLLDVLNDEQVLSRHFMYAPTETAKKLEKAYTKKK